jgi:hypothetical protein
MHLGRILDINHAPLEILRKWIGFLSYLVGRDGRFDISLLEYLLAQLCNGLGSPELSDLISSSQSLHRKSSREDSNLMFTHILPPPPRHAGFTAYNIVNLEIIQGFADCFGFLARCLGFELGESFGMCGGEVLENLVY